MFFSIQDGSFFLNTSHFFFMFYTLCFVNTVQTKLSFSCFVRLETCLKLGNADLNSKCCSAESKMLSSCNCAIYFHSCSQGDKRHPTPFILLSYWKGLSLEIRHECGGFVRKVKKIFHIRIHQ